MFEGGYARTMAAEQWRRRVSDRQFPWWLVALLGVALAAVGVWLAARPVTTVGLAALLLGAAALVVGVVEIWRVRGESGRRSRLRVIVGLLTAVAGVFLMVHVTITVQFLAVALAVLLVARGVWRVWIAVRPPVPTTADVRIAGSILGAAEATAGVIAWAWSDAALVVVSVVGGLWLAVTGLATAWKAFRQRGGAAPEVREPGRLRRIGKVVAAVAALAVAVPVAAIAGVRPGELDDFYATPRTMPSEPGVLIDAEKFTRGVPEGARGWRILYSTTRSSGEVVAASGLVVVPEGATQPVPVIQWSHGTTGWARQCAPSALAEPFESGAMFVVDQVVANGWALVATDYIGLGTEGPHPYLIGDETGRAVLDAARAAKQLDGANLSDTNAVWGHSQGGGGALWAAGIAPDYAPDVPIAATVALAPASNPPGLVDGVSQVTGGQVFGSFVIRGYTETYPDVTMDQYIQPAAQWFVDAMSTRCLSESGVLASVIVDLGSSEPQIAESPFTEGPFGERLAQNVAPTRIGHPVMVAQGDADPIVTPASQREYTEALCASSAQVDVRWYEGFSHVDLVEAESPAIADAFAFTRALFAGETPEMGCR